MTVTEVARLVMQAVSLGRSGEVYTIRMGEPVKIVDLAEDLIRLSGLEPGRDIEIRFTGIRPGEALSDDVPVADAQLQVTGNSRIFLVAGRGSDVLERIEMLPGLEAAAMANDRVGVLRMLARIVPGFSDSRAASAVESALPASSRPSLRLVSG